MGPRRGGAENLAKGYLDNHKRIASMGPRRGGAENVPRKDHQEWSLFRFNGAAPGGRGKCGCCG